MAATAPSPPHASRRVFLMGVLQHGDNFGGRLNGLQPRAGQQRSPPYGKAVLAARASSPPAVQGSRVVVIFNNERLRPVFDENSRELNCSPKNELFARNQTKAGYSVCFAHLFFPAGYKER